jgi:hypothetical protein
MHRFRMHRENPVAEFMQGQTTTICCVSACPCLLSSFFSAKRDWFGVWGPWDGLVSHTKSAVEASWSVMAHAQKPEFVYRRNGRVHLNRRVRQLSRLLAAEVCASAVVMLDTPCSEVVWRVLTTHSILQFPLHFPFRASPCAITFQLESTSEDL